MTFTKAAWAIDGPLTTAALARIESFASNSDSEGIVTPSDLKVTPLESPGPGLYIAAGAALVLNKYLGAAANQMYTVSNPGAAHQITVEDMPASNPAPKSYIVAITVGDPEFSQAGHPWMTSNQPAPGEEADFQYVRPAIIECAPGATALTGNNYPGLALARLDIPANTTAITAGMITDLRAMAHPRTWLAPGWITGGPNLPIASGWQYMPNAPILTVKVPTWAVRAKLMGHVEGMLLTAAGAYQLQPIIDGTPIIGNLTDIDEPGPAGSGDRKSYSVGGNMDVRTVQGQTVSFYIRASALTSPGGLSTTNSTSVSLWVYFEEQPI